MTVEGRKVTADWVNQILDEEVASFKKVCGVLWRRLEGGLLLQLGDSLLV